MAAGQDADPRDHTEFFPTASITGSSSTSQYFRLSRKFISMASKQPMSSENRSQRSAIPTTRFARRTLRGHWLRMALLAIALSACQPHASPLAAKVDAVAGPASEAAKGDVVSVMTDSVNYQYDRAIKYTLYDLSTVKPTAVGGAIAVALASGGGKDCCLALPRVWRAGTKVRIEWAEATKEILPEKYSKDLEIPHYDEPADLYVVFYPAHEVEVLTSGVDPTSPAWAGRIKQTPWNDCVAKHGRKPCFWALPKQFDTDSAQGFCTYLKDDKDKESDQKKKDEDDDLCAGETRQCMTDYEDEKFCKNILWGPRRKYDPVTHMQIQ